MLIYDESIWASISLASKLRSLDFRGFKISMVQLHQLTRLTELRHLRLDSWSGFSVTADIGRVCRSLRKLESVSLMSARCACPNSRILSSQ